MLYIKNSDYEFIVQYMRDKLPEESCGILAGRISDGNAYVEEVFTLTNIKRDSKHFLMDVEEQLHVMKNIREKGYTLLGNFHSHPDAPAMPSEEDMEYANDTKLIYVIFSFAKNADLSYYAYHVDKEKNIHEEKIQIIE